MEAWMASSGTHGAQALRLAPKDGGVDALVTSTGMAASSSSDCIVRAEMLTHRGVAMRAAEGAGRSAFASTIRGKAASIVRDPIKIRSMNWPMILSSVKVAKYLSELLPTDSVSSRPPTAREACTSENQK